MSDQGSTYAVLQSAPVMVSPFYNLPKRIFIASELKPVPEDVTKLPVYHFSVEREAIAEVEQARKKMFEEEEALNLKKKEYEQEKIQKQKVAARKIAPGFLDTDTRILQPQQTHAYEALQNEEYDSNTESVSPKLNHSSMPGEKHFDYLKFEQGLAPADPWDAPENDMAALRSILGHPKPNYSPKITNNTSLYPSPQYPHSILQQHAQFPQPYQKNEGVYWNFQNTNNNNNMNGYHSPQLMHRQPQPQQHTGNIVPVVPPKLFNNSPLPTSSTSSPIIPPPTLPPPSDYHKTLSSTSTPPPLPPLPTSQPALPNENLITELCNMGFTRLQAIEALEKNEYDLIKATHFLLDQA